MTRLRETGTEGLPHAMIVTHAHGDHVGHCARLARRFRVPVFATDATLRAAQLGANARPMASDEPFDIGAIRISPVPVPHDAPQVALVFEQRGHRAALVTDVGEPTAALIDHVRDCDALLLESNHDEGLLRSGPYPEPLKRRIASSHGHLSNSQAGEVLRALGRRTRHVVLMHLSETNNTPDIALASARAALGGRDVRLSVAHQRNPVVIELAEKGTQLSLPGTI